MAAPHQSRNISLAASDVARFWGFLVKPLTYIAISCGTFYHTRHDRAVRQKLSVRLNRGAQVTRRQYLVRMFMIQVLATALSAMGLLWSGGVAGVRAQPLDEMASQHPQLQPQQLAQAAQLQSAPTPSSAICKAKNPCIALVLGGGGARGGAHVGVIEMLEQLQIPVDMVIGTSIGAYIGGLYALGNSPQQIQHILQQTPWQQGFRDRVTRQEMPLPIKQNYDEFPIRLDLGMDAQGIKLPKGVLHGQAMAELIQQGYGAVPSLTHFDQLPIPFRAIATRLSDRKTMVLAQGNLLQAVQASMSIPGIVRPVELDGQMLVDGGVANNLPIQIARQMGATHIIAVAIDAPLLQQAQLDSAVAITEQLTNFLVRQGVAEQKMFLQPQDVLLEPDLAKVGTLEFDKFELARQQGRVVAKRQRSALTAIARLAAQATPEQRPMDYSHWQRQHRRGMQQQVDIVAVQLDNQTALADALLLQRFGVAAPANNRAADNRVAENQAADTATDAEASNANRSALRLQDIQQGIRRVYGLDALERFSGSLVPHAEGGYVLNLQALPKSWGPAYLNFRLQLDDDFRNTHSYQLAASYRWTQLSPYGAEWRTAFALGTDKMLQTQWYYPLADSQFYTSQQLKIERVVYGLEDNAGLSDGDLAQREFSLGADLGYLWSDHQQFSVGLTQREGLFVLPVSLANQLQQGRVRYERRGVVAQWEFDSLDHRSFATQGWRALGRWQRLQNDAGAPRYWSHSQQWQWQAAWQLAPAHVLHTRLRYDHLVSAADQLPLEQFSLGGLLNLSGYPRDYLFGSDVRFASVVYLHPWLDSRFRVFDAPLYVGFSLERGLVKQQQVIIQPGTADWVSAASLFIGWDSPLGPLYLGYGQADVDDIKQPYRFYLSLGQYF